MTLKLVFRTIGTPVRSKNALMSLETRRSTRERSPEVSVELQGKWKCKLRVGLDSVRESVVESAAKDFRP